MQALQIVRRDLEAPIFHQKGCREEMLAVACTERRGVAGCAEAPAPHGDVT